MSSRIRVKIVWEIIEIPEFLQHAEGFCDHEVGRGRMNRSRRWTAEEREKKQKRRESFRAEEKPLET